MLVPASRVKFDSTGDLVDYVSKGFPPKQDEFNKFIDRVSNPMSDEEVVNSSTDDVTISAKVMDVDPAVVRALLTQVYENQRKNARRYAFINVVCSLITGMGSYYVGKKQMEREKKKEDKK